MIQHVCDRCGATMTTWRVIQESEESDPRTPPYDYDRGRFRLNRDFEVCIACQHSFTAWLEAGKDLRA